MLCICNMYYLMLARSALCDLHLPHALSLTQPHPSCHKSFKARHDNIKWFKVFAIGAGPRFTKLSSPMRSQCQSAVSYRRSSLAPIQ